MEELITRLVANPDTHCKWLNTLSMMENTGARKIARCEHPVFVSEIILKHAAEEARHAYFLKKQIAKIHPNACPTYEQAYVLAPESSYRYLHALDIETCRYLKKTKGFENEKLKYAAYLLVTYAIEVRADALYPVYQKVLRATGSKVTVRTIMAEEENHLQEMTAQLKDFLPDWEEVTKVVVVIEEKLFGEWVKALTLELN